MRQRRRSGLRILCAVSILGAAGAAGAAGDGPIYTPLAAFTDGKPAKLVWIVPGTLKKDNMSTDFICTNLGVPGATADIGVEFFDATGTQLSSIGDGTSACAANDFPAGFRNVPSGSTIVIGITGTAQLLETCVFALGTFEGSARIVSTSSAISCNALLIDTKHKVYDPVLCPNCPPPPVTSLKVIKAKKQSGD